jgi:hypothetical protein
MCAGKWLRLRDSANKELDSVDSHRHSGDMNNANTVTVTVRGTEETRAFPSVAIAREYAAHLVAQHPAWAVDIARDGMHAGTIVGARWSDRA